MLNFTSVFSPSRSEEEGSVAGLAVLVFAFFLASPKYVKSDF